MRYVALSFEIMILRALPCHHGVADKHWTTLWLSGMFLRWEVTDTDIMSIFMKGK